MTRAAGISPAEFMAAASAPMLAGNTEWAARYARDIRRVVHEHAARAPRSLQAHLGPSELGTQCDRQVAGKMARLPVTNHVTDPWPSVVGTAVHAWLAEAFTGDNERSGRPRWVAEQRVTPHPNHPGTADLYDGATQSVCDHKILGQSSMAGIRSVNGPPRKYVVQLLLYGRGYRLLGLPVRRVVLIAYPRTLSSLDELYVWEREHTPADDELLDEVFARTDYRRQWAIALLTNTASLMDVPAVASDEECYFCPFYRPQSAHDGGAGCPGPRIAGTP